jgi:regulator of protease activity HflC (stomatin/prohibitin superfamily)
MASQTDIDISSLAAADRRLPVLTAGVIVSLVIALAALAAGTFWRTAEFSSFLGLISAVAILISAALAATRILDGGRSRLAEALVVRTQAASTAPAPGLAPVNALLTGAGTDYDLRVAGETSRLAWLATWGQAALMVPAALAALAIGWWLRPLASTDNGSELALAVVAVVVAFPLLILERRLHHDAHERFAEGRHLARLLRLGVWTLVIGGGASACRALDVEAAVLVQWVWLGLVLGIAGELALRGLTAPFLPVSRAAEARGLGDSLIAALLFTRGDGALFGHGLKERFGIDLTQSWAIRFLKRAALPLVAILLVIGWLISGLTTLGVAERGVYERFGAPVTILQPGLHAHLPWPFGRVHRVEFGQVHELPLAGELAAELTPAALAQLRADADTPADFDRLWDKLHPSDATYLVPGTATGSTATDNSKVGYQLLNSDVRVMWRVALCDAAAYDSVYHVADPKTLVRSEAMRLMQRMFATRSLAGLIGEDRDTITSEVRIALQARLDAIPTGLEITAIVIDAIHPPRAAVPAYHGVQAAEIGAFTDIARAHGQAASVLAEAQRDAYDRLARGSASASETVAEAHAAAVRFGADHAAFEAAPEALRLERWLQIVGRSLSKAQLTVVDHRLPIDGGPLIDLRKTAPGND